MLTSKIIKYPTVPEEIKKPIEAIAKMVIDYNLELGIPDPQFDVPVFVREWGAGTQHILGFYHGEELVGFLLSSTQQDRYTSRKFVLVESIYVKPAYRTEGTENVELAILTMRAYAKTLGVASCRVHANPQFVEFLKGHGGEIVYTGMEVPV